MTNATITLEKTANGEYRFYLTVKELEECWGHSRDEWGWPVDDNDDDEVVSFSTDNFSTDDNDRFYPHLKSQYGTWERIGDESYTLSDFE